MVHAWPKPVKPLHKANRECAACGLTASATKYKQTNPGEYHWGVAWRRGAEHGIVEGLRNLPPCSPDSATDGPR